MKRSTRSSRAEEVAPPESKSKPQEIIKTQKQKPATATKAQPRGRTRAQAPAAEEEEEEKEEEEKKEEEEEPRATRSRKGGAERTKANSINDHPAPKPQLKRKAPEDHVEQQQQQNNKKKAVEEDKEEEDKVEERPQKRARRGDAGVQNPKNEVPPARKTRSSAEAAAHVDEAHTTPLKKEKEEKKEEKKRVQRKIFEEEEEDNEDEGGDQSPKLRAHSSVDKGKRRETVEDLSFQMNRLPDTSFDMSPITRSFNSPGSVRSALIDPSPVQSPTMKPLKGKIPGAVASPPVPGGRSAETSDNLDSSNESVISKSDALFGDVHFEEKKRPIKRKFVREDKAAVKSALDQQKKLFEEVDEFQLREEYD